MTFLVIFLIPILASAQVDFGIGAATWPDPQLSSMVLIGPEDDQQNVVLDTVIAEGNNTVNDTLLEIDMKLDGVEFNESFVLGRGRRSPRRLKCGLKCSWSLYECDSNDGCIWFVNTCEAYCKYSFAGIGVAFLVGISFFTWKRQNSTRNRRQKSTKSVHFADQQHCNAKDNAVYKELVLMA